MADELKHQSKGAVLDQAEFEHIDLHVFDGQATGDSLEASSATQLSRKKNNISATTAPGVTDDTNAGYKVGSVWLDLTGDKAYICLDVTAGAAVWTEITQAAGAPSGAAGGELGGTYPNPTVNGTHSGTAHHTKYTDAEAISAVEGEATLDLTGDVTIAGTKKLQVDVIDEKDADAGVTIDGVLLKDSAIPGGAVPATHSGSAHHTKYTDAEATAAVEAEATLDLTGDVTIAGTKKLQVDVIDEKDADAGVTIDGVLLKDSAIPGGAVPATHSGSAHHTKYTDAEATAAVEAEATLDLTGDVTIAGTKKLQVDVIDEKDADAGVTIDGVLLKDSAIPGGAVPSSHSGSAHHTAEVQATTATAGKAEIATQAEVDTGTDNTRIVTPDNLAGSIHGEKVFEITVFERATDVAMGDGKADIHIPSPFNGMNLVEVHAEVITAGTTGTTDIQIANVTQGADMLSTKLTIDSGETGSDQAATPAIIDAANDDVATNDMLRIDVDAVSTTSPKGLIITLVFRLP